MNFQELFGLVNYDQVSISEVLIRLVLAGISGLLISGIYKNYQKNDKSNTDMIHTLIFISIIICIAMMIIGNNLASAFGLVGAVSIIRFRTAVKSSRDMTFVLFAVVMGMSCGLGFLFLSIIGLVFTGLTMVIVFEITKKSKPALNIPKYFIITIKGIELDRKEIEEICLTFSSSILLDSIKIEENKLSYTYKISLNKTDDIEKIIKKLKEKYGNSKLKISISIKE